MDEKNRRVDYESEEANESEVCNGRVTSAGIRSILERQGYRCALSGEELTPETCSLDHIVPLSKGGKHALENIHLITNELNRMKGQMTLHEFRLMCAKVATWGGGVV